MTEGCVEARCTMVNVHVHVACSSSNTERESWVAATRDTCSDKEPHGITDMPAKLYMYTMYVHVFALLDQLPK